MATQPQNFLSWIHPPWKNTLLNSREGKDLQLLKEYIYILLCGLMGLEGGGKKDNIISHV